MGYSVTTPFLQFICLLINHYQLIYQKHCSPLIITRSHNCRLQNLIEETIVSSGRFSRNLLASVIKGSSEEDDPRLSCGHQYPRRSRGTSPAIGYAHHPPLSARARAPPALCPRSSTVNLYVQTFTHVSSLCPSR